MSIKMGKSFLLKKNNQMRTKIDNEIYSYDFLSLFKGKGHTYLKGNKEISVLVSFLKSNLTKERRPSFKFVLLVSQEQT